MWPSGLSRVSHKNGSQRVGSREEMAAWGQGRGSPVALLNDLGVMAPRDRQVQPP